MEVDNSNSNNTMDEDLYSRQLYVMGKEAMVKMQSSNILIIGMKGLGVEIAKNVALAGVKSLTLYDPNLVEISDLSSQFFLTPEDVGKPRALALSVKLSELNQYVPISVISELSESTLATFQVIVATEISLEEQVRINKVTHPRNIKFIVGETRGLFAQAFVDLGEEFVVIDANGEEPVTGIVSDIEANGTVTMLDDNRHGMESGSYVRFTEVEGMALEGVFEIENLGPYAFKVDLPKTAGTYTKGGLFTQVKMPKTLRFEPLAQQLMAPEFMYSDFAKFDRPAQLHLGFQALHGYTTRHGALPRAHHEEDATEFLRIVKELAAQTDLLGETPVNEGLLRELAYQARGDIPGVVAVYGGFLAQEVLKACSGKFSPLKQWLYFDSLESLPDATAFPRTAETCAPTGSRYDHQVAVFGAAYQTKLSNVKVFLVGSGAIGCEMLKNWAMMGLGRGPEGKIIITDMDSIEKSNLNRQFLFRPKDVGGNKSEVAARAVVHMNPDLAGKIEASLEKVGADTEHIFDDAFWNGIDFVTNALDNVEARTYVDRRCVFFKKALLESGTLGTKGNTQVVIPNLTESYSSSQDPPEKSIPLCTLRSFPNKIDHTIAWAKSLFQGYFTDAAENVNLYLTQPDFIESTLKTSGDVKGVLETVAGYLNERPYAFDECIRWARIQFEKKFNHEILQLLYNFPKDATTSAGAPFWSGPKRAPEALVFDINNVDHYHFVVAGANLLAYVYGLKGGAKDETYRRVIAETEALITPFVPRSGIKIQANDSEPDPNAGPVDDDSVKTLAASLPATASMAGYRLTPVEFEKDDDTNHHIEFILAASNCRALNYAIDTADFQKTKFIAGRIIPAIATTTALVTGLICLELYKVVDGKTDLEQYKNGFINLALPFFGFSEPIGSQKSKYNDTEFDKIWSRFELEGNLTLREIIDHFQNKEGLEITMLSYDVSLLYASFFPAKKLKDRYNLPIRDLIKEVSKKEVEPHVKNLILEVCVDDKEGEDVEVPFVCIKL